MTAAPGDAERLAAAADAQVVVAGGGDGTVHEIVNGLLGAASPARLMALPLGTGCDFSANMEAIAADGSQRDLELAIDVGRARFADGSARYFVNAANVGASTASTRRVSKYKLLRALGRAAYVAGGLPEVLSRPTEEYGLALGETEARSVRLLSLSLCNGPRFGGGLCLAPESRLDDATLHMAEVEPRGVLGLGRTLLAGFGRGAEPRPGVNVTRCGEILVQGTGDVELDGELPGCLPASFTVLPAALTVLV